MNDLDLLKHTRHDVPARSDDQLAPLRAALLDHVQPGPTSSHPARRLLVIGAAATIAFVAGTALVLDPWEPAPASAATLLGDAARTAARADSAAPGAFRVVTTRAESLGYVVDGPETGAYRVVENTVTYVPADPDGVWVRRYWTEQPSQTWGGPEVEQAARRDFAVSATEADPGEERAVGGRFDDGELGGEGSPDTDTVDLPRDPRDLLAALRAQSGGRDPDAADVVATAGQMLSTGLLDPDLVASIYRALALLPDIKVVDRGVALDGRTGTGVGAQDDFATTFIIIDSDTDRFLGMAQQQRTRLGAVPAGTTTYRSSLTTSTTRQVPPLQDS